MYDLKGAGSHVILSIYNTVRLTEVRLAKLDEWLGL